MTWAELTELASLLSERGELVTMLHTTAPDAPAEWAYGDAGVHIVRGAVDMVVTSDGVEHVGGAA